MIYRTNHQLGQATNIIELLVACTPNGAICFVSPLYAGSVSDVELTCVSGFPESLQGKHGISVMADRGFTLKINSLHTEYP